MSENPLRQYTKEQLQTEIDLRKSLKKVIANPSIFCDDHISLYYTPECDSANITIEYSDASKNTYFYIKEEQLISLQTLINDVITYHNSLT